MKTLSRLVSALLRRQSLGQKLYGLLLMAAVPLCLIAGYQASSALSTAATVSQELPLFLLSQQREAQMGVFMEGVTDAVDSGQLSRKAAQALAETRRLSEELDRGNGTQHPALTLDLERIAANLEQGRQLEVLMPLQGEIYRAWRVISDDQLAHRRKLDNVVYGSARALHRDTATALFTILLSLGLVCVLGRKLIGNILSLERASHAAAALNQAIMDTAPIGVLTTDAEGLITTANRSCHALHGYAPETLPGLPVSVLEASPGSRDATPAASLRECERSHRRVDGSVFEVGVFSMPLKDAQGHALGGVQVVIDISERRSAAARIEHLALHDGLTGLANRLTLQRRAAQLIAPEAASKGPFALALIDLDHFKEINDTYGHAVGDEVLKVVAQRLRESVRSSDTVVRMGGDEFAILLPAVTEPGQAAEVGEKILAAMAEVLVVDGRRLHVSASIGVAFFPTHGQDLPTLLCHADVAMYESKSRGRDACTLYEVSMAVRANDQSELRADLRGALGRGELLLHYQPLIDSASGRVVALEALMRWNHPQRGLVPPDQFIPLAEESGNISSMGAWALRQACSDLAVWRQHGWPQLRMAVNVSPRQFRSDNLLGHVTEALQACGLEGTALELEITESTLMNSVTQTQQQLARLRAEGVHIVIDDFGTGYSSLSYLTQFPVQTIKVDRSFVRQIGDGGSAEAIAGAIVAMAHSLNLHVVAEGVETLQQQKHLVQLGCEMLQGYRYSRPVPASQVLDAMDRAQAIRLAPQLALADTGDSRAAQQTR